MHKPETRIDEPPDSATTARDSLYQDVTLNSDGNLKKEDDIAIEPLDRAPSGRQGSLAPTERDEDDGDNNTGGDGTLERHSSHARDVWKFHLRPADDDEPE